MFELWLRIQKKLDRKKNKKNGVWCVTQIGELFAEKLPQKPDLDTLA